MNAKLLVVIGKTTKREVALQLPAVLGRSREADVTVAHPLISRRHCEISENNGLLMLRDLASLNGTMIGGRRVESAPLLPDAEFTIGPLTFRVLYEYDGDLESVPETRFVDEVEEPAEAGLGEPIPQRWRKSRCSKSRKPCPPSRPARAVGRVGDARPHGPGRCGARRDSSRRAGTVPAQAPPVAATAAVAAGGRRQAAHDADAGCPGRTHGG